MSASSVAADRPRFSAADVPKENLFRVGRLGHHDHHEWSDRFVVTTTRSPFVLSRAEAGNLLGYLILHANLQPSQIEDIVHAIAERLRKGERPTKTWGMRTDDGRRFFLRDMPQAELWLSRQEMRLFVGLLVHTLGLSPAEIDAAVIAIEETVNG